MLNANEHPQVPDLPDIVERIDAIAETCNCDRTMVIAALMRVVLSRVERDLETPQRDLVRRQLSALVGATE